MTLKKVKCGYCDYHWETRSKAIYVSCPNCLRKTKMKGKLKMQIKILLASKEETFDGIDLGLTMESTDEEILNRLEAPIKERVASATLFDGSTPLYLVQRYSDKNEIYLYPKTPLG